MAEKEYIEREAIVDHLENAKEILRHDILLSSMYAAKLVDIFEACVKVFPTVDVAPVRHGEWQEINGIFRCSRCGYSFEHEGYQHFFNYCPNCGAKMDGDPYA